MKKQFTPWFAPTCDDAWRAAELRKNYVKGEVKSSC